MGGFVGGGTETASLNDQTQSDSERKWTDEIKVSISGLRCWWRINVGQTMSVVGAKNNERVSKNYGDGTQHLE